MSAETILANYQLSKRLRASLNKLFDSKYITDGFLNELREAIALSFDIDSFLPEENSDDPRQLLSKLILHINKISEISNSIEHNHTAIRIYQEALNDMDLADNSLKENLGMTPREIKKKLDEMPRHIRMIKGFELKNRSSLLGAIDELTSIGYWLENRLDEGAFKSGRKSDFKVNRFIAELAYVFYRQFNGHYRISYAQRSKFLNFVLEILPEVKIYLSSERVRQIIRHMIEKEGFNLPD